MSTRKIIHIDMDAFFASVEQRDFPQLRGKPVVVGGRPGQRGVVAAASYEARRFGIHSAMPATQAAMRCPTAIFTRPRFDVYRQVSQQIRAVFMEYTDLVEPLSLDEAYLDVTENKKNNPSGTWIANEIRRLIYERTQLTASAGVAPNKFLAKVASDINKPNGICVITPDQAEAFVQGLAIGKFYGIGKATEKKMHELGIFTGADLRQREQVELIRHFGKAGAHYYHIARGIDERRVSAERVRKSVGVEETFAQDLSNQEEMEKVLMEMADELERRLGKEETSGKTVTLKLRYDNFETITRSRTGQSYINDAAQLYDIARGHLLKSGAIGRKVRLLGITVTSLDNAEDEAREIQMPLPLEYEEKGEGTG